MDKGLLVIISAPSGGGKDSIIRELLKLLPGSSRLVTTTSRQQRPGDTDGVDYNFVSKKDFESKINNDEMVEYNNYVGNYYGIEKEKLEKTLADYDIVFTQIEVNGKHNLDRQGIKHLSIFLLPDSLDIFADRIRKRGGVTEEQLVERLETAQVEIESSGDYDYRIVNEDGKMDETVAKIREIIESKLRV